MAVPGDKQIDYAAAAQASTECLGIATNVRDQITKQLGIAVSEPADWVGRTKMAVMTQTDDMQQVLVNLANLLHVGAEDLKQFANTWVDTDDRAAVGVQATTSDSNAAPTAPAPTQPALSDNLNFA